MIRLLILSVFLSVLCGLAQAAEVIAAVPALIAAKMPFADVRGAVAGSFQHIGQSGLLHPKLVLLRRIDVVEDAKPCWKLAAH